jgi:hypothetical protein
MEFGKMYLEIQGSQGTHRSVAGDGVQQKKPLGCQAAADHAHEGAIVAGPTCSNIPTDTMRSKVPVIVGNPSSLMVTGSPFTTLPGQFGLLPRDRDAHHLDVVMLAA